MGGTVRGVLTLLVMLAWSIITQAMDTVTVLASSQQLIVSQQGVLLKYTACYMAFNGCLSAPYLVSSISSTYLYNMDYAEIYPEYCGGVMKLNSTIATSTSLIFNGVSNLHTLENLTSVKLYLYPLMTLPHSPLKGTAIKVNYVLTSISGDGMIYLDGCYEGTFKSHSLENSCNVGEAGITNLPEKPHNITVVNANVMNATFLSSFIYTPYSSTDVARASTQSTPVSASLSMHMATLQLTPTLASAPSTSKASKGPVIGGVIGGIIILIVALFIIHIIRRRSRLSTPSRASTGFDGASSVESEKRDFTTE
ncbi:hypothetical protein FRB95_012235 [Tulasnella sp. JGI-2019a]|nr:hypothetical protein FRB95_012235 [Tulasnella sp. JGI-2019a]